MTFQLTDEQVMIKETLAKFLEKEIAPMVEEYERQEKPVTKEIAATEARSFGFLGGSASGGSRRTWFRLHNLLYDDRRIIPVWPSLRATVGISNSFTRIYEYGTDEQKKKYLGPLLRGEKLGFLHLRSLMSGLTRLVLKHVLY